MLRQLALLIAILAVCGLSWVAWTTLARSPLDTVGVENKSEDAAIRVRLAGQTQQINERPVDFDADSTEKAGSQSMPRKIAPDIVPGPDIRDIASLERIEAPVPVVKPNSQPAKKEPEADWRYRLLFRPVALSAGEIEIAGYRIMLDGVVPTPVDKMCGDAEESWPCGMKARTEFRAWLRGRALNCRVPPKPGSGPIVTDCSLAGEDVAEWLVHNGWAEANADSPLLVIQQKAAEAGSGFAGR